MGQMVFDEKVAAQLEIFYQSRDVIRRRGLVQEALGATPGDAVLDIGCGPGFYVHDMLEQVGETGFVTGVDASAPMLAIARRRVDGRANARLLEGEVARLPVEDAAFDRALSVQVFEYLTDVDGGLAELMRTVRPGGRVVLWDIDWSTLSLHADDAERSARMLTAWDRHLADPCLPRTLLAALRRSGFHDVERQPHVFTTTAMDPQTFGGAVPFIVRQYLAGLDDLDQADADAWVDDLRALDSRGEYSCAVVQFCFTATRPG